MKNSKSGETVDVLISLSQIKQLTKLTSAHLQEYFTDGNFPAPARFGDGPALWSRADVIFWLEEIYDGTKTET